MLWSCTNSVVQAVSSVAVSPMLQMHSWSSVSMSANLFGLACRCAYWTAMHMMQSAWKLGRKERRIWTAVPCCSTTRCGSVATSLHLAIMSQPHPCCHTSQLYRHQPKTTCKCMLHVRVCCCYCDEDCVTLLCTLQHVVATQCLVHQPHVPPNTT